MIKQPWWRSRRFIGDTARCRHMMSLIEICLRCCDACVLGSCELGCQSVSCFGLCILWCSLAYSGALKCGRCALDFMCVLVDTGVWWAHAIWCTWVLLALPGALGFTLVHFASLSFTWCHLGLLGFTPFHLTSLRFTFLLGFTATKYSGVLGFVPA